MGGTTGRDSTEAKRRTAAIREAAAGEAGEYVMRILEYVALGDDAGELDDDLVEWLNKNAAYQRPQLKSTDPVAIKIEYDRADVESKAARYLIDLIENYTRLRRCPNPHCEEKHGTAWFVLSRNTTKPNPYCSAECRESAKGGNGATAS